MRRGADTDRGLAELDAVQVLLEDLLLREMPLEAERPERLADLRAPPALAGPEQPRELHRDRRCARDDAPAPEVVAGRARDGERIDTVMLPEPHVLHRDEGEQEIGIHLGQRNPTRAAAVGGAR